MPFLGNFFRLLYIDPPSYVPTMPILGHYIRLLYIDPPSYVSTMPILGHYIRPSYIDQPFYVISWLTLVNLQDIHRDKTGSWALPSL